MNESDTSGATTSTHDHVADVGLAPGVAKIGEPVLDNGQAVTALGDAEYAAVSNTNVNCVSGPQQDQESGAEVKRESVEQSGIQALPTVSETPPLKRKRPVSPPWQFATANVSTIKTSDGRRSSARVHASASNTPGLSESESQGLRRSTAGSSRVSSPPWKNFEAEGPSSIQVDGVRKSGRMNKELVEPKRISPRIRRQTDKLVAMQERGAEQKRRKVEKVTDTAHAWRQRTSSKLEAKVEKLQARIKKLTPKRNAQKRDRRASSPQSPLSPIRRYKNSRLGDVSPSGIKLRLSSGRHAFLAPHPHAVFPSSLRPPQSSIWQLMEDAELKEMQQPYTENERGPPSKAEFARRHEKAAEQEVALRAKIVAAGEPGGILTPDNCSIYDDVVPQRQLAKQYGHLDHLASHVFFFRSLQIKEELWHRQTAKKLATEAVEYWKKKQGPTAEDLEAEAIKMHRLISKQVVADLKGKWDLIWQHVDSRRRAVWEAEQEVRRQEKLKKQLAWSEHMIARQRGMLDGEEDTSMMSEYDISSQEGGSSDDDGDDEDEDEDENMSDETGEDEGVAENEPLDEAALGAYLAQREAAPPDKSQSTLGRDAMVANDSDVQSAADSTPGDVDKSGTDSVMENEATADRLVQVENLTAAQEEELDGASSDESIDMDSEDYTSNDNSSANESEHDSSEESDVAASSKGLLGFFSKQDRMAKGLPTPVTSAEGEHITERDEDHEAAVEPGTPSSQSPSDHVGKQLVPQPTLLHGTLRSYQHAGLDWLASLYRNNTNGILADEMGLGKTIQTISLFAHIAEQHNVWEAHLVIVPTSVILNWVTEFQKFLPGFRVLGYYGTSEERQAKRRGWVNDPHHENREKRGYNVIVTSYNIALKDINAIRTVRWHYMVLDEAHNIRNFNSQRFQNLIKLRTRARLLLTGTPLQNSLTELWSLLTFLTAGREADDDDASHGSLEEFLARWKEPVNEIFERGVNTLSAEASQVVGQLHTSLRPFMLRRMKADVEKDLPKKTEHIVVCKLSKRQRQLYQDYMGLADTKAKLTQGNAISAGRVLLSLRRVCNHPDLFDPRPIQTSYALEKSPLEPYSIVEGTVRRLLGGIKMPARRFMLAESEQDLLFRRSRGRQLSATVPMKRRLKTLESDVSKDQPGATSIAGVQALLAVRRRREQIEALQVRIHNTEDFFNTRPVYGSDLRELVTVRRTAQTSISTLGRMSIFTSDTFMTPTMLPSGEASVDRLIAHSSSIQNSIGSLASRADAMHDLVSRYAMCTPEVTAPILDLVIPSRLQTVARATLPLDQPDATHEPRIRLSINFPDARLLVYDSGKLQRLTYLLRDLQARGSRSLIFTQMSGTLNILEQFLGLMNLPYLRLDGSTPVERRQLYSAEFNRPDSKYQCMILSSRAGGVGLNLTGASSVIFYDLDWNPQMDKQCMDRAHRIGQVRDVEVYKMVSEKTVEENILKRANQKSLLDQTVIQEGNFTTDYDMPETVAVDDVNAAINRFLCGAEKSFTKTIESVEDKEDVQAAQQARKEDMQDDDDFAETSSKNPSVPQTPGPDEDVSLEGHIDGYMIRHLEDAFRYVPYVPPIVAVREPGHRKKQRKPRV